MKKYIILFLSVFLFMFASCGKLEKQPDYSKIETMVALELESFCDSKQNTFSDETLKAVSVIIRTNLKINPTNNKKIKTNEKYLNIAKQTCGKVLKNKNGSLVEISFDNNENYSWQKSIKKSRLLEFANKNNISLTSLSTFEPVLKNERVIGLKIGGKYFDYKTLANEFNLESNIIEKISENRNEIIINGKNKGFSPVFDLEKSEQLSNDNYNYLEILSVIFDEFIID